ncbi:bacteriocin [Pedobacter jeongneungensis]|uniref:bacteriocin n=1 Tax=Pedobacter jeongneungensis TaxID=947309 RepID=UPI0004693B7C|nr:bacteriocin [Pedobacter jeongneungensis]
MKSLELKNLGVKEMNTAEMSQVEGGGIVNNTLNELLASLSGTLNSVGADTSAFLNKTVTNVLKLVWSL